METRGSKRKTLAFSAAKPETKPSHFETISPSKKRPQKRLRFSDSLLLERSTGLTTTVDKASLRTAKPRRASTPAITGHGDHEEIQFTPLRHALSTRTVRQIGRHGLNDEVNKPYVDQKTNKELRRQLQLKNEEYEKLKAELFEAKQGRDLPADLSCTGIEQLQQSFTSDRQESSSLGNYTDDGGLLIYGDDATAVGHPDSCGLDAKQNSFDSSQGPSFRTLNFEDSPVCASSRHNQIPSRTHDCELLSTQLQASTNRAEAAEVALKALDLAIQSLGFSVSGGGANDGIWNIKNHFREMRIEMDRLAPGETITSFDNSKLIPEALAKLNMGSDRARDREAEWKSMREQQRCLKGNFDDAIVAAEKANSRVKELEETIDTNAEGMLEIRMRAQAWEQESKEHEDNNRLLIATINKYRGEVKRLEELVISIETEQAARLQEVRTATTTEVGQQLSDMVAKVAAETRGRQTAAGSAADRLRKLTKLEASVMKALQQIDDVKEQLAGLGLRRANREIESDHLVTDPILPMMRASVVRSSSLDYNDDDHVEGSVEILRGKSRQGRAVVPGLRIKKRPRRRDDSGIVWVH
nr:hypothetical protein LTR18_011308 [Exophiala xenobiotica]